MLDNYKFWKNIWDSKGKNLDQQIIDLPGWTNVQVPISSKQIAGRIKELLSVTEKDTILEVGCGVGFLSREFNSNYTGLDYSSDIVNRHLQLYPNHKVIVGNANNLPFADNSFDLVFCCGVFQYLPTKEFADRVIDEMYRVSRRGILLADLKNKKTHDKHFVYSKEELLTRGFVFSDCIYDPEDSTRYNALLKGEKI